MGMTIPVFAGVFGGVGVVVLVWITWCVCVHCARARRRQERHEARIRSKQRRELMQQQGVTVPSVPVAPLLQHANLDAEALINLDQLGRGKDGVVATVSVQALRDSSLSASSLSNWGDVVASGGSKLQSMKSNIMSRSSFRNSTRSSSRKKGSTDSKGGDVINTQTTTTTDEVMALTLDEVRALQAEMLQTHSDLLAFPTIVQPRMNPDYARRIVFLEAKEGEHNVKLENIVSTSAFQVQLAAKGAPRPTTSPSSRPSLGGAPKGGYCEYILYVGYTIPVAVMRPAKKAQLPDSAPPLPNRKKDTTKKRDESSSSSSSGGKSSKRGGDRDGRSQNKSRGKPKRGEGEQAPPDIESGPEQVDCWELYTLHPNVFHQVATPGQEYKGNFLYPFSELVYVSARASRDRGQGAGGGVTQEEHMDAAYWEYYPGTRALLEVDRANSDGDLTAVESGSAAVDENKDKPRQNSQQRTPAPARWVVVSGKIPERAADTVQRQILTNSASLCQRNPMLTQEKAAALLGEYNEAIHDRSPSKLGGSVGSSVLAGMSVRETSKPPSLRATEARGGNSTFASRALGEKSQTSAPQTSARGTARSSSDEDNEKMSEIFHKKPAEGAEQERSSSADSGDRKGSAKIKSRKSKSTAPAAKASARGTEERDSGSLTRSRSPSAAKTSETGASGKRKRKTKTKKGEGEAAPAEVQGDAVVLVEDHFSGEQTGSEEQEKEHQQQKNAEVEVVKPNKNDQDTSVKINPASSTATAPVDHGVGGRPEQVPVLFGQRGSSHFSPSTTTTRGRPPVRAGRPRPEGEAKKKAGAKPKKSASAPGESGKSTQTSEASGESTSSGRSTARKGGKSRAGGSKKASAKKAASKKAPPAAAKEAPAAAKEAPAAAKEASTGSSPPPKQASSKAKASAQLKQSKRKAAAAAAARPKQSEASSPSVSSGDEGGSSSGVLSSTGEGALLGESLNSDAYSSFVKTEGGMRFFQIREEIPSEMRSARGPVHAEVVNGRAVLVSSGTDMAQALILFAAVGAFE
eukprot:g5657.t1